MRLKSILALAALLTASLALTGPAFASASSKANSESKESPYIVLDPLPVSIIRDSMGRGMLVVEVGLDTKTLEERKVAEHLMPRLVDLYVQVLNLYASRDLRIHGAPDAEVLHKRLQAATDQVLGPDKGVLLMRQLLVRRAK